MNLAALIVTGDPALADGLLRLAAAADAHAEVAYGPDEARPAWTWPALILVGADMATEVASAGLQRRPGVVLVTSDGATSEAYRLAVEAEAQDVAALPDHEDWLINAFAAACEPEGGWATTLCVVGSRGGADASVLATALGLAAAGQACAPSSSTPTRSAAASTSCSAWRSTRASAGTISPNAAAA